MQPLHTFGLTRHCVQCGCPAYDPEASGQPVAIPDFWMRLDMGVGPVVHCMTGHHSDLVTFTGISISMKLSFQKPDIAFCPRCAFLIFSR
jgi:hypothetical protein